MKQNVIDIRVLTERSEECLIYGAGVYGKTIYELLEIFGLNHKVKAFIISCLPGRESETVMEIPILSFYEAEKKYSNAVIFVAIKGKKELYEKVRRIHKAEVFFCQQDEIELLYYRVFVKLWENPVKNNKIIFLSNRGKGYMCNGKYITEELIKQQQDVEIVWAVRDLKCKAPRQVRKVKVNSPEYFYELATSKIWIDNCRKDVYIHKRRGQYYIQTWHGSGPLKKVERDAEQALSAEYIRKAKHDGEMIDWFLSSTSANSNMYQHSFYSHGKIMEYGSPRNDLMFNSQKLDKNKICQELGIKDQNSKIVLFAPTFRRTIENSVKAYDLNIHRLTEVLESRYESKFTVMIRLHPNLSDNEQLRLIYSDCIDATDYEDVQELLAISDILITDYSSILWDFSLQRRPVFLYQNDEEEYLDDRGFYCPLSEWPYPRAHDQEELYEKIAEFDEKMYLRDLDQFLKKWNSFDDGYASKRAVELIMKIIMGKI